MSKSKYSGGIGFRNLQDFNPVMLRNQGWRLLVLKNSLAARILTAIYYLDDPFLSAQLGNNPGYMWRIIWKTQDLVKHGVRRSIRTGEDMNICQDP